MRCGRAVPALSLFSLALLSNAPGHAAEAESPSEAPVLEPSSTRAPRIAITAVSSESAALETLSQRVKSWFTNGADVSVRVTSAASHEELLESNADELRVWVVPVSRERVLVTFSSAHHAETARHLVRAVELRDGLDELGLERLASVIHSASVALDEGLLGLEREHALRALSESGLLSSTARAGTAPSSPELHQASPSSSRAPSAPPARERPRDERGAPRDRSTTFLLSGGYGVRLRGREGLGQGPSIGVGVQWPFQSLLLDVLVDAQFLLPSSFAARGLDVSVQTTPLRARLAVESRPQASFAGVGSLGLGADFARIHAGSEDGLDVESEALIISRPRGSQWRASGDLSVGVLWCTPGLDLGLHLQLGVLFTDVSYVIETAQGSMNVAKPWDVQPGLTLQGRIRSPL